MSVNLNTVNTLSDDPRGMPAYSLAEAAHYLRIPLATLRSWVRGRYYPTDGGKKFFKPVIELPDPNLVSLSFINLVEAHVLLIPA
jgi:DNA-binding transcriptional regulator YiaG